MIGKRRLVLGGLCALLGLGWLISDIISGAPWQGVGYFLTSIALACLVLGLVGWDQTFWEIIGGMVLVCAVMHVFFETAGMDIPRQNRQSDLSAVFLELSLSQANAYGLDASERALAQQGNEACSVQIYTDMQRSTEAGMNAVYVPMEVGFFDRLRNGVSDLFSPAQKEAASPQCLDVYKKFHAIKPELMERLEGYEHAKRTTFSSGNRNRKPGRRKLNALSLGSGTARPPESSYAHRPAQGLFRQETSSTGHRVRYSFVAYARMRSWLNAISKPGRRKLNALGVVFGHVIGSTCMPPAGRRPVAVHDALRHMTVSVMVGS
ncbi:MAG: hypothetical protein WC617_15445 [Rhodanobacter sp.]|jgi:hypothetical protein